MRKIVVTGVDRGLGLSLANNFLAAGHRVFATCLEPEAEGPRSLLARYSAGTVLIPLDLGSGESIVEAGAHLRSLTSNIDWLVNNAGILGEIEHRISDPELDFENILETFRINALGTLRVIHELWTPLASGKGRLIVNISSEAGSVGQNWRDSWFGYCLSKSAMNMAGALVHEQLRKLGGRVMQVHPGYLKTYMHGTRNDTATYDPDDAAELLLADVERRLDCTPRPQPEFFDLHGNELPW